jgi:4'-phosphopantetheinyl transferase
LALVAVTYGCEIGVDVEELRPIEHWREIAARYFHPAETDAIAAADPSQQNAAFLRCWTRKEAILKALSFGLGQSLNSFAVPVADSVDSWVELSAPSYSLSTYSRLWLQSLAPCLGYVAAVATGIEKRKVTGFIYRW